jgi:hypothetical protein
MEHGQVKRLMHEWEPAGLLPEPLVAWLASLFSTPPDDIARLHIAAFLWWDRQRPIDASALIALRLLIHKVELAEDDRQWIERRIQGN